jgi:hypothetical protein
LRLQAEWTISRYFRKTDVTILSILALTVISAVSVLHFVWAARIWWPIPDEVGLVRAVAGFRDVEEMPSVAACAGVGVLLFLVAVLVGTAIVQPNPGTIINGLLLGAGIVFIGRGGIGLTPFWARITPEQPFRRLDRVFYSPLCLVLGVLIWLTALSN